MNKVLTNYCYSWYRTKRLTNVLAEEATADQHERADMRASERPIRTNVLTAEATADRRERADMRASADRIV